MLALASHWLVGLLGLNVSATARVAGRDDDYDDDEMSVSLGEETRASTENHQPTASN